MSGQASKSTVLTMATDAKLRRTMMESLGKSKSNSEATMSVVIESTKRQFVAKRVSY